MMRRDDAAAGLFRRPAHYRRAGADIPQRIVTKRPAAEPAPEKTPGYAEQIRNFAFGPKDAKDRHFTSGIRGNHRRNGWGPSNGLKVIGLLSREHCEQAKPAHSSGKKLMDVADVTLDNAPRWAIRCWALDGRRHARPGCSARWAAAWYEHAPRRGGAAAEGPRGEPVFLPSHQFVGSRTVEDELEVFYAIRPAGRAAVRAAMSSMNQLANKRCLIIGGSGGIGRAAGAVPSRGRTCRRRRSFRDHRRRSLLPG